MFDREIIKILDNTSNYLDAFNGLRTELVCKTTKYTSLEGLSNSCE
jgi:hypothetical protein